MFLFDIFSIFTWQAPPPVIKIRLDTIPHTVEKPRYVNFKPVIQAGISKTSLSYLGINGSLPTEGSVDWNKNIQALWAQKLRVDRVSPATKQSVGKVIYSYTSQHAEVMTINAHISQLNMHLSGVKGSLKWSKICSDSHIKHCDAFKKVSLSINGEMLTAYSMTELMPYRIGRQNYEMMNLYMRYAGRNYLDAIPSLGDPYLSMGRYQFTSYALGHDKNGPRSANKISRYSTGYSIPQSVIRLRGLSSDRAAYYFSVYNIASLFKSMSDGQVKTYLAKCQGREPLTEYIATAHHNPRFAKRNMLRWIDGGCKKPLVTYQTGDLSLYSKKTSTNYSEVLKRI